MLMKFSVFASVGCVGLWTRQESEMGRVKTSSGVGLGLNARESKGADGASGSNSNASHQASADLKLRDALKELHQLAFHVQEERSRGEHNLSNIAKTHEKIQQEIRISPYYKTKLKGLYNTAMQDAESEATLIRRALEKIAEIKSFREIGSGNRKRQIVRRGVLMSMLQQNALTLPLWIGKSGEKPPPLCGASPAEANYIAKAGDKVAARVKGQDDEENWILAEVVSYSFSTFKYEVDDIDAEAGKERHVLSRRRILPLPIWKANPETDPDALFPKETLVLALYPQTTCFYRALIYEPPKRHGDDYLVLFEDTSYQEGYSPPLNVAQRYVIAFKEEKKK